MAVRLGGGKAFVPEVHRQASLLSKHIREGLGLGRLRTEVSGHIERVSHDNRSASVFSYDPEQRSRVLAAICADQGRHRLCRQPHLIGDSDPHPAVAYVEAEHPSMRGAGNIGRGHSRILITPIRGQRRVAAARQHNIER